MLLATRAAGLRVRGGRCSGLLARRGGTELTLSARAVVIADGGFPGDPELFRRHIGPRPELCPATPCRHRGRRRDPHGGSRPAPR